MSDPKREQLPLLCEDLSDEEYQIQDTRQTYQRRLYPDNARSKYYVKGAASIIKQWPDHMSSLLTYWWMGLAMIGLTVFIIYNSVVAMAVIPSQSRLNKMQTKLKLDDKAIELSASYKTIYMHIINNDNLTVDLNEYLPYIEIVAKNYPKFDYNFVILFNDTLENIDDSVNEYQKNKIALNSLWKEKNVVPKLKMGGKVFIQRNSLTTYMNGSPLKKYWRHLPDRFMGFLIRCVAIWNKGGISVNPLLFTPKSPHPDYMEEIKNILKSMENPKVFKKYFYKGYAKTKKVKKKMNNIRDIINDDSSNEGDDVSLAEEETRKIASKVIQTTQEFANKVIGKRSSSKDSNRRTPLKSSNKDLKYYSRKLNELNVANVTKDYFRKNNTIFNKNESAEQKLFPMFLKYLFSPTTERNALLKSGSDRTLSNNMINIALNEDAMSNIDRPVTNHDNSNKLLSVERDNLISSESDRFLDLNLDLKGNIVATKTPCHAFLGTIFNNVIHHVKDETVTDFIINELTIFCKGTWTSCKGVNVLFL